MSRLAAAITIPVTPAARQEKLEAVLVRAAAPDEDVALLADLLCLPCSERCPLPNFTPQRKKERTLEALIRQLEGLARREPVVMVFEDAHWIDPTSRELLDLAVEHVRRLPVLLIVTFRPEFQPPWIGQPQVTMLVLKRLDRRDGIALIEQIAGGKALPDAVADQIVDRTDGVPLFVEELTKSVLESGLLREETDRYVLDGALPPFAIPTSLHDSLMARLDRLASVRLVAQIGAAIGREFLIQAPVCRRPFSRGRAASRSRPSRRFRAGVPARHPTRCGLCLQACAGARRGARQPAAQLSPAIACADRRSARSAFARDYGHPARTLGAALRRGRAG